MSTSSRLSELRQITLNARAPNIFRSLGLKTQCLIKDTGVDRTIDQTPRTRASFRTSSTFRKDTVSQMCVSRVLCGLITHRDFEAPRSP